MSNAPSRPALRLSVFNHKGGVGKTTLTMNLAATLARQGRRVLLVDTDPQCNLTSYLFNDDVVDDLLDHSDSSGGRTIWSAVRPVSEALGSFLPVAPMETAIPNLYLIPGDIRLSEFEADLSDFWSQSVQRKMRGFRGMTALSEVVGHAARSLEADYVFYDSGPNIGPLNRSILLDCGAFIVPVACDLFSLRALKTLGRTLVSWITNWRTITALAPADAYLLSGRPVFLGYIPEGFKVYGGAIAQEHSQFLSKIEKEIYSQLIVHLTAVDHALAPGRLKDFRLGEVKNFGALVPASQRSGLPLYEVQAGSADQRSDALGTFTRLASRIEERAAALDG